MSGGVFVNGQGLAQAAGVTVGRANAVLREFAAGKRDTWRGYRLAVMEVSPSLRLAAYETLPHELRQIEIPGLDTGARR